MSGNGSSSGSEEVRIKPASAAAESDSERRHKKRRKTSDEQKESIRRGYGDDEDRKMPAAPRAVAHSTAAAANPQLPALPQRDVASDVDLLLQQRALLGLPRGPHNPLLSQELQAGLPPAQSQLQRAGGASDSSFLAAALQQQILGTQHLLGTLNNPSSASVAAAAAAAASITNPLLAQSLALNNPQEQNTLGLAGLSGGAASDSSSLLARALAQQQLEQQQNQQQLLRLLNPGAAAMLRTASTVSAAPSTGTSLPNNHNHDSSDTSSHDAVAIQAMLNTTGGGGSSLAVARGGEKTGEEPFMTGRPPVATHLSCDEESLSAYQCLARKQIELFEAGIQDVESNAQGRNRPIVLGQVGIRCRHCTHIPPKHRARGGVYYPAKLAGIYQAAQNMTSAHLCEHCQHVPEDIRKELLKLHCRKSSAGGGKKYWADGARVLGVYEDRDGLRFERR